MLKLHKTHYTAQSYLKLPQLRYLFPLLVYELASLVKVILENAERQQAAPVVHAKTLIGYVQGAGLRLRYADRGFPSPGIEIQLGLFPGMLFP